MIHRAGWNLFENGCPGGETLRGVATRADRVIARIRAVASNVLVFAHRDILRILIVRWIALPVLEARRLDLATTSVSAWATIMAWMSQSPPAQRRATCIASRFKPLDEY